MAKPKGPWSDYVLRGLAKRRVTLPLDISELTYAAQRRRLWRFLLVMLAIEFLVFVALFAALGVLPGFIDRAAFSSLDAEAENVLLAVLFGAPLLTGVLVLFILLPRLRRRADEAEHPWRFQVLPQALTVTSAGGRRWSGGWADWRYLGYRFTQIKLNRIPIALHLGLGEQELRIEFARFRRREIGQLAAALLQGLAAAGQSDRPGAASSG